MADPIMRVRCPKADDTSRLHLAVDIHQPLTLSMMVKLMAAVATCSCGAEMDIEMKGTEVSRG